VMESSERLKENTDLEAAAAAVRDGLTKSKDAAKLSIISVDEKMAAHKALDKVAQSAEADVRKAELAIDASGLKRLMAQVKLHQDQIANAVTEVKKPCTECGTVLETMSVEAYVAHRQAHLDTAKVRLDEGKKVAMGQALTLKAAREIAAICRSAVPDVSSLTKARTVLTERVSAWATAENAHKVALTNLRAAQQQHALRTAEPNPSASALALCVKQIAEATDRLDLGEVAHAELLKEEKKTALVAKVFGPAGVRAQILDNVTPFLNARTADYLSALSDGEIQAVWTTLTRSASGDLKEKFSIDVCHSKGGDSFAALSGGEKRKVRIATALALQDLVASRASQPLQLLLLDEIDDALDPAGLERLMVILERKARERDTVIVISHSDLTHWIDSVTTVRKTALWNSVVEGALCS